MKLSEYDKAIRTYKMYILDFWHRQVMVQLSKSMYFKF